MKRIALIIVAVFEILCGFSGFVMVLGGLVGISPYEAAPTLWFGVFPILSLIAGIMLLLRTNYAVHLSAVVILLQIPFIYTGGVTVLRLGLAFSLYITGVWNSAAGANATVLGINLLAFGMLAILLWGRAAMNPETEGIGSDEPPAPPEIV